MTVTKPPFSTWMASIAKVLGIALLLINAVYWFHSALVEQAAEGYSGLSASLFTLTTGNRLMGWFISSLQLSVLTFALFTVANIFQDFGKRKWFAERFSRRLKWFGIALLLYSALSPIVQMLISMSLTYGNPAGQRMLSVSVSLDFKGVIILFVGILLIMMAKVMTEATRISDENHQII